MEYTAEPARCELMCACKGRNVEIAPYWKDAEVLSSRVVEMYIPFRGGDVIVAAKITLFR